MDEPVAVLVVPAQRPEVSDPFGLENPWSPAPQAFDAGQVDGRMEWQRLQMFPFERPPYGGLHTFALVLWWEGALVPEGWDRAVRQFFEGWLSNPPMATVLHLAERLVYDVGSASRVVLLERHDGRLVER